MPTTSALIEGTIAFANWLISCALLPIQAEQCRPFWMSLVYLCATIAIVIICWVVWKIIEYKLKYRAAIRAQAERERIADPETMKRHHFLEAGDVVASEDITDPHLAVKIRKELEKQRLERIEKAKH